MSLQNQFILRYIHGSPVPSTTALCDRRGCGGNYNSMRPVAFQQLRITMPIVATRLIARLSQATCPKDADLACLPTF